MDTQFRIKYNELERTDPEAFKFMKMLYGHAVRAADHPWEAQAALHKVVHFYRNKMSMNQLRNLHRLFPAVEKIFSQYGRFVSLFMPVTGLMSNEAFLRNT
ncbi:hypothetical protein GCK32_008738, partial [Trichostrongylus colubriformis]